MSVLTLGIFLAVGFMVLLVISSLRSKSRNSNDYYHSPDDSVIRDGYVASSIHHGEPSQDGGDWGGRDMSHDHHNSGHHSDSGSGDAGGGGES
jgi:hypothetical protein